MPDAQDSRVERFSAPSVSTVIFAPRSQNYSLSAVSGRASLLEALALECLASIEEFMTRFDAASNWKKTMPASLRLASECLSNLSVKIGYTTSVTLTLPTEVEQEAREPVAARAFPFITHHDFLTAPVEGLFFDPDDFVER